MAPAPPTILARKQEFIAEQTRLLSQPLSPSRAWRAKNSDAAASASSPAAESAAAPQPLGDKAADAALVRLNHRLQQHSWRVYSPAATRHVAEQIEQLYLQDRTGAAQGRGDDAEGGSGAFQTSADLADAETVASLPEAWPSARDVEAQPLEAARYAEQAARLKELIAQRDEATALVSRLRAARDELEPFQSSNGGEGVQKNLVTKNGELEQELERMRILMARVGDRVSRLKEPRGSAVTSNGAASAALGDPMAVDIENDGKKKVANLLDSF